METLKPHVCVIGAGPAGLAAATTAAALGASVVLVEKSRTGGTSLHTGAVPMQVLVAAARRAYAASALRGPTATRMEFAKVRETVRNTIAAIAPNDAKERLGGLGIRVIDGAARFTGRGRLAIGDTIEVRARRYIIAAGSLPALPDITGLSDADVLTNETIFDLERCPEHLIVIGATANGLALAQSFRRFGAGVTVLDQGEPLAGEDPECARMVLGALVGEGIALRTGVTIAKVERAGERVRVTMGEDTIDGSHLLIAGARRPNVDSLGLDRARVRCGPDGIAVNAQLRTRNRRVYAAGDVTGGPSLTNAARHQGEIAARLALGRRAPRASAIPRVTFTDPELAHVGLTDEAARRRNRAIRVLRWPYYDVDRAQAEGEPRGHIKVVTDRRGGILGATIVGAGAGEMIAIWSLAIGKGLDITAISGMIVPYPTLGEVGKRAAMTYFSVGAPQNWLQRLVGWLRR